MTPLRTFFSYFGATVATGLGGPPAPPNTVSWPRFMEIASHWSSIHRWSCQQGLRSWAGCLARARGSVAVDDIDRSSGNRYYAEDPGKARNQDLKLHRRCSEVRVPSQAKPRRNAWVHVFSPAIEFVNDHSFFLLVALLNVRRRGRIKAGPVGWSYQIDIITPSLLTSAIFSSCAQKASP